METVHAHPTRISSLERQSAVAENPRSAIRNVAVFGHTGFTVFQNLVAQSPFPSCFLYKRISFRVIIQLEMLEGRPVPWVKSAWRLSWKTSEANVLY